MVVVGKERAMGWGGVGWGPNPCSPQSAVAHCLQAARTGTQAISCSGQWLRVGVEVGVGESGVHGALCHV